MSKYFDPITSFEIWAMGHAWVIPQSYHHQHYCAAFGATPPPSRQSPWMKNGFGLRSGLLSTTHQVQCSRGLCVLWHIFITCSTDSSEAVLLMYVGLMVCILSSWVMKLFQGWWWCNAWWQRRKLRRGNVRSSSGKSGRPPQTWESWSWPGKACFPLVHTEVFQGRSLNHWEQEGNAPKIRWRLMVNGRWLYFFFFWDANVEQSSCWDF